jgi:hypothetical protein
MKVILTPMVVVKLCGCILLIGLVVGRLAWA